MLTYPKTSTKSVISKLVGNKRPSLARVPIPGSAPHNQRETHNSQLFPGEGETEDSITDEKFRLLMGLPQELNMPGAPCLKQSSDKKRNQESLRTKVWMRTQSFTITPPLGVNRRNAHLLASL